MFQEDFMKKSLFVIAGILMISSVLWGGGGNNRNTTSTDPNSPLNLTVFIQDVRPRPAANNPLYQYIRERLNVTFEFDFLVGDIAQRRGTMIAGGQYPDLIELRETAFIEAGALIPLEGLIQQYAPRIKAYYEQAGVWNKLYHTDGHIYYLPNFGAFQGLDHQPNYDQAAFWIQKAVLKDAGYPQITTVDQYFDLIENYYRRNPTINGQPTIPFVILTHDWRAFELWNPPNFLAGYPNDGNGIVDPVTHEYKNFFTQEISKRWFKKLNELNARGLIDRASFTDNYDQYSAKIASGRVLGQSVQGWQFMYDVDTANRDRGQNIRTMAPLPIVFDANIRPRYRNITIPNLYRGVGISVSAKDPVRIMRFFDQFMTEEVQRVMEWGIEGQHWQYNAQRIPYRTAQQRANWQNQDWQEQNRALLLRDFMPKIEGSFTDGYPTDLSNYYPEREAMILPEDRELYAAYGVTSSNELMDKNPPPNSLWFPTWNLPDPPDGSPAQIALERCQQTMRRLLPQMILATPAQFDSLWDAYVREMTVTNNIAVYERYMQEQLNQRIREWSR
jgi:putative aldouronate transport system substrate-binding protein